jgi:hypothetical protein
VSNLNNSSNKHITSTLPNMGKRKASKAKGSTAKAKNAAARELAVLPDPASTGAVKLGTLTYPVKVSGRTCLFLTSLVVFMCCLC